MKKDIGSREVSALIGQVAQLESEKAALQKKVDEYKDLPTVEHLRKEINRLEARLQRYDEIPTQEYLQQRVRDLESDLDRYADLPSIKALQKENLILRSKIRDYEHMGMWHTAWQWLENERRIVIDEAFPMPIQYGYGNQPDKQWHYYNLMQTRGASDEEYENLKQQYIEKFGGWDYIDLDTTSYDGRPWWEGYQEYDQEANRGFSEIPDESFSYIPDRIDEELPFN